MLRTPALVGGLALSLFASVAHAEPNVCRSTCEPIGGDTLSYDEARAVSASFDGILNELRTCLDSVGAASINPAVILRFDANGNLISKRYDLSGYENLACARDLENQPTSVVIRRSTSLKCESRCGAAKPASVAVKPAAPSPAAKPAAAAPPPPVEQSSFTTTVSVGHAKVYYSKDKPLSQQEWYGYQTLIADGASLAAMVGGGASGVGKITGVGVAGYLFATPIVHWVHGNVGKGFASMGLRFTAPPLLGLIGLLAGGGLGAKKGGSFGDFETGAAVGGAVGFLAGYAGVIALDSAVFAYKSPSKRHHNDDDSAEAPAPKKPSIAWQPTIDVRKTQTTVGIAATF